MKITPRIIAQAVGGKVEGDADVPVTGFGPVESAGPGEVSFIANPKYAHYALQSKASALLVGEDFDAGGPVGATLIRVPDPYDALARLMGMAEAMKPRPTGIEQPSYIAPGVAIPDDAYVGAFAYIGEGAEIGAGAAVYPQAYVGAGVKIGEGSVVRAGAKIYEGCEIGRRCIIHSGAVIGADGFGFAPNAAGSYDKIPQTGNVVIEDDVEIGANTAVDRATFGSTRIGRGTKLDNLIQVAHNVQLGTDNVFAAQTGIAGSTHIGSGNRVGGQCGFAGHITVGDNNEFGAQSGIPKTVGSGRRLIGYPAVDAGRFARTQVYLARLPELFKQVSKLNQ